MAETGPRSDRRWRVLAGLVVCLAAVTTSHTGVESTTTSSQLTNISAHAAANSTAVRGRMVVVTPPPPPPVMYPTGVCDSITAGLPGLNGPFPAVAEAIGTSAQGRTIWAEYWGPAHASTVIVMIAQVHGNECSPSLVVDAVRRHPISSSVGIWLIPTLNPDGYAGYTRANANGVDLNADGGRLSQPESRALMTFLQRVRPALTVHIHSPNGFAGTYPASTVSRAASVCQAIGAFTAITCTSGGAGTRSEHSRWFLWQGHAPYTGESLLIELHAISDHEVPTARPRPGTRSVTAVRSDAQTIVALLVD